MRRSPICGRARLAAVERRPDLGSRRLGADPDVRAARREPADPGPGGVAGGECDRPHLPALRRERAADGQAPAAVLARRPRRPAHAIHQPGTVLHAATLSRLGAEPQGPLRAMI
ncbi:hydroxylase [Rhodococcus ruber]|nr:hydroxylase [Rhodococcus ruber]